MLFIELFSPVMPHLLVNALLSIAAAMQLQTFNKLKGKPFTSLMMIGNLRNLSTNFLGGYINHDIDKKIAFQDTFLILASFAFGALLNGFFVTYLLNERFCLV